MKAKVVVIQYYLLALLSLFLLYLISFSSLPFSWYIKIDSYQPLDVCTGDVAVTYRSERTPRWGIKADVYSQIVVFKGTEYTETTITRGSVQNPISYGYEPNTYGVQYETTWFYAGDNIYTWPKEGVYGSNEWVTIYPLPFIEVNHFIPASEAKFNVINCNI